VNPSAFHRLLKTSEPAELGPGPRSGVESIAVLNNAVDALMKDVSLERRTSDLVHALVLLWHDHLEASHVIAQRYEDDADGSYVHAIVHRREPDYSNAKYWFRRARQHPAYAALSVRAGELLSDDAVVREALMPHGKWDAVAFVDACEEAASQPDHDPRVRRLQAVQQAEFENLLEYLLQR
jgi:hypothetical protein